MEEERAKRAQTELAKKALLQKTAPVLATYLPNGELQCLVCEEVVRTEALWQSHCLTKTHIQVIDAERQCWMESG